MSDETKPQPAPEPVLAIYPDGSIRIGAGYSVGDVLRAVELAREAVLSIVPVRPARAAEEKSA